MERKYARTRMSWSVIALGTMTGAVSTVAGALPLNSGATATVAVELAGRFVRGALGFAPLAAPSGFGAADLAAAPRGGGPSTLAVSTGVTDSGTADFAVRDVFFATTSCTSLGTIWPATPMPA